jgi:hypothetical protein
MRRATFEQKTSFDNETASLEVVYRVRCDKTGLVTTVIYERNPDQLCIRTPKLDEAGRGLNDVDLVLTTAHAEMLATAIRVAIGLTDYNNEF